MMLSDNIILSHALDNKTPLYGGAKTIEIIENSSIKNGDTANSLVLKFSNHSSTHIDVPYHFFEDGKTLTDYEDASFWVFCNPICIDVSGRDGYLVTYDDVKEKLKKEHDLLLIRTGFEKFRYDEKYWSKNPGLSSDLAKGLRSNYPNLRAIGVDVISITSYLHRDEGRRAHREFLGNNYKNSDPIILIEDMALEKYNSDIRKVIVMPLFISHADGSPCTVFGFKNL